MSEPARYGAVWTADRRMPAGGARRGQTRHTRAGERRGPGGRPRAIESAPLRLVADGGRLVSQPTDRQAAAGQDRVRTPLRLTRRGRIVVTAVAVLAIGAASLALAGAAEATGALGAHGHASSGTGAAAAAPGAAGSGLARVVIRPGQSLWSVAEAADPNADTRQVIQQILQLNSLTSDQVQPGQKLWVPRD